MSLAKNCMILNLHIGRWAAQRLDKSATQKVTDEAGANADAARVNKHLIDKAALKPIETAAAAIRTHFYDSTLPWRDNGDRLLTRKGYMAFMEKYGKLEEEYRAAVEKFLTEDYKSEVERAAFRMGTLFDINDYPKPAQLRDRFYVTLDIDAVTEAGDFRVELDDAERKRVVGEIESTMNRRLNDALHHVWERVADVVRHYCDRMTPGEIFRDSTVENIREIVALLPALNLTDDPELERIGNEIEHTLCGADPKELRKDDKLRAAAKADAQRIMDEMEGLMAAFSNAA